MMVKSCKSEGVEVVHSLKHINLLQITKCWFVLRNRLQYSNIYSNKKKLPLGDFFRPRVLKSSTKWRILIYFRKRWFFFSLELHDPDALNYPFFFFSTFTFFRLLLILLEVIHFSPFLARFLLLSLAGFYQFTLVLFILSKEKISPCKRT